MFEALWKLILRRGRFSPLAVPAFILWLVSLLYRLGARMKLLFSGPTVRVGAPVISVGNITVGGSGKTPLVGLIAREFLKRGSHVGIVSSGYGRTWRQPIMARGSELQSRRAVETGDEILLLAFTIPGAVFSIDRSKTTAAKRLAESGQVDLILVDDGFQHRKLYRDINIVTFDVSADERLLKPFPYGVMREPFSALSRAQVIVLTRADLEHDRAGMRELIAKHSPNAELYDSRFCISGLVSADERLSISFLQTRSVFLFAGIASFESLVRQVTPMVRRLDFALELSDHQRYNRALLHRIKGMADRVGSDCVLTTGKDWVKVGHFDFGRESYYLDLEVELQPAVEQFIDSLAQTLKVKQSA